MASVTKVAGDWRGRFDAMELRDRIALVGLAVFLLGLILYYGIWLPANNFLDERIADRDRQLSLVRYMRSSEAAARAAASSTTGRVPGGQMLLTEVARSAQAFNINPNRLQPEGTDSVSLWFDGVPFTDLIRWLQDQSSRGIFVRQVTIDRQESPGLVNARIVLRG